MVVPGRAGRSWRPPARRVQVNREAGVSCVGVGVGVVEAAMRFAALNASYPLPATRYPLEP